MSGNQARNWRRGTVKGAIPKSDFNRLVGRILFPLFTIAVFVMIIRWMWPSETPRNWVVTYASPPLDELSLIIPFAKEDSTGWIPDSKTTRSDSDTTRSVAITEFSKDADQIVHEFEALKKRQTDRTRRGVADTLVVYVVGYGVNANDGPQIIVKGYDGQDEQGRDAEASIKQISVKALFTSLINLPVKSIFVVFDCSRTLDCSRRGWERTGSFPDGLENVVRELVSSSDRDKKAAEKLWVISATGSQQLGLTQQKKNHSVFGKAWHEALQEASKVNKKPIELKALYDSLSRLAFNESNPLRLLRGGHGLVEKSDLNKLDRVVVWHNSDAEIKSANTPENAPESENVKLVELTEEQRKTAGAALEKLGLRRELEEFWRVWERCKMLEATPMDAKVNREMTLSSPVVYAPHHWRRLMSQMVCDEAALLAGKDPKFSTAEYEKLLQNLETRPKSKPSAASDTVCDRLRFAWFDYDQNVLKRDPVSGLDTKKEEELLEAHRQYANSLFVFPELAALEQRLSGVANARHVSRQNSADFKAGAQLLQQFYQAAFLDSEKQNDAITTLGKSLSEWRANALKSWSRFADELISEERDDLTKNPRSKWVAFELLLTSHLWSCEDRLRWRVAQVQLPLGNDLRDENLHPPQSLPKHGLAELTEKMSQLTGRKLTHLPPFPAQSGGDWPNWYKNLADKTREMADQSGGNSFEAHFLAALCDPRDYQALKKNYAIWFQPQTHSVAAPELVGIKRAQPRQIKKDGTEAKDEIGPEQVEINLDRRDEFVTVEFDVCWKPSHDPSRAQKQNFKLKPDFDKDWIRISNETIFEVEFDGSEKLNEDGTREHRVKWRVGMVEGKERRNSSDGPLILQIRIDEEDLEKRNPNLGSGPKVVVDAANEIITFQFQPRNYRSASLSLRQRDWSAGTRKVNSCDVFEVPMLTGHPTQLEWRVANESPVDIKFTAKLWEIKNERNASDDSTSLWGRIPLGSTGEEIVRPRKDAPPIAEFEGSLGVGKKDEIISWKPLRLQAQEKKSIEITNGLYCVIDIDGGLAKREYWIEFIPEPPRKWLIADGKLIPEGQTSRFEISVKKIGEDVWPWTAYSNFVETTQLHVPNDYWKEKETGGRPNGVLRDVAAEFEPKSGANDESVFLSVGNWPRAFRWKVKTSPNVKGKQDDLKNTYRVNFMRFQCRLETQKPDSPIKQSDYPIVPLKGETRGPIPIKVPPSEDGLKESKLLVSLEADALSSSFTDLNGKSDLLQIQQEFEDQDQPKILFERRADRHWITTAALNEENNLIFTTNVTDFDDIPLSRLSLHEGTVKLRALFLTGNPAKPVNDGQGEVSLLLDGTQPTMEIESAVPDSKSENLTISLVVADGNDRKPGSGVKTIRVWLRPDVLKPKNWTNELRDTPTESFSTEGANRRQEVNLSIKHLADEDRQKNFYLFVQAEDRVGLKSDFAEFPVGELRKKAMTKAKAGANEPVKDGVIQGRLRFPKRKDAKDFTIRLEETGAEVKTPATGEFRFEKLDLDKEYTLTVTQQTLNGTKYGFEKPRKIKATLSSSDQQKQLVELDELLPSKR